MKEGLQLRDSQVAALAFGLTQPKLMNLSDPGVGKTAPTCAYMWHLWSTQGVKSVWPQPKSLLVKNRQELLDWSNFKPEEVIIIDGTKQQRAEQIADPRGKVWLMGFKRWSDDWKLILEHHPEIKHMAVDEFHLGYSTWGSKQTQAWYESSKKMKSMVIMTGTIIRGRLTSAFPAIHAIEPRYYGHYGNFLAQHAIMDEYDTIYGWKGHAKLAEIFRRHGFRRTFEDEYGKEAKVIIPETVEMSPKQREAYREFEEAAVLELEDSFLMGDQPAVNAIRCRQILAHPETFGLCLSETTGKDERLKIHFGDAAQSGDPIAVFAALVPEQERIVKLATSMGLRAALINGNVPATKRAKIDEQFRAGLLDCVVASPATAGIGFNWAHLKTMVFASTDYMDDSFIQAYRRGIRGQRDSPLLIYVLEYRDSIEQRIFQIIENKSKDANKVDPTKEVFQLSGQTAEKRAAKGASTQAKKTGLSMADMIKR
ncbi:DEAD/DEAH box helicase [Cupriavidus sp. DL-D2]|uniref:DEAD/DEAH box helicase n=1 Tax=Cupriavidus sp. DL-D2 TaxID=3144974 RepID=UPI003215612C